MENTNDPGCCDCCCLWHRCGSTDRSAKRRIMRRVILAICLSIVGAFAAAAVGAPVWAQAARTDDDYDRKWEIELEWSLWRRHFQGTYSGRYDDEDAKFDDDVAYKRKYFIRLFTWRTVEVNQGAALAALVAAIGVATYYWISACYVVSHITELVLGSCFIVVGVIAITASTMWKFAFDEEFDKFYSGTDDETSCDAGCVMEAVTGCLCVSLGIAMIVVAAIERSCCTCCACGPAANTDARGNGVGQVPKTDNVRGVQSTFEVALNV